MPDIAEEILHDGRTSTLTKEHVPQPITEKGVPIVPLNWTTLYHGTNLALPKWLGREELLEEEKFTVEGMGLSAISEEERKAQKDLLNRGRMRYDTTLNYASSSLSGSQGVELRVIVPSFHSRRAGTEDIIAHYTSLYGAHQAREMLQISDEIYWNNFQGGRHPIVPGGMVLDRLDKRASEKGMVIVTYVPEILKDVYEKELLQHNTHNAAL